MVASRSSATLPGLVQRQVPLAEAGNTVRDVVSTLHGNDYASVDADRGHGRQALGGSRPHRLGWRSNVALTSAVLATIAIQLAIIYLPALQPIFETHQLSPLELAVVLVSSTLVFIAVELEKRWRRHPSAEGHRRVAPAS